MKIIFACSVCFNPSHVDAREKKSNYTWVGLQASLIFDNTPKFGYPPSETRNWSWGISRKFGLVCYDKLQNNQECPDFELRWCCRRDFTPKPYRSETLIDHSEYYISNSPKTKNEIRFDKIFIDFHS